MEDKQALTVFGSRDEVREIQARIMSMMLPGGKKLAEAETRALAQLAVAHGLDPFNGEIWMIPGSGPMIGIKGLRKKAREQISAGKSGNFWTNFVEIVNAEQRAALQIPDGALAFECRLFDTETINTYVSTIKQLKDAGMPWEVVSQIVGAQPYTSGYGYFKRGETSRMTPVQCAMKRAEADAIKRRFDVPFGLAIDGETGHEMEEYQGEWKAVEEREAQQRPVETREAINSQLFDDETAKTPPAPPQAETKAPAPVKQATKDPAPTSGMWSKWYTLTAEAKLAGIEFTDLDNSASAIQLADAGSKLRAAIAAKTMANLAAQKEGTNATNA